ncbi:teichoic acids export ABC transporter ATP-binding subunit TagH [Bacillus salipaludis]|uniref:Teichoic acids export ABC transporter ATP-binding subunit TagH n=1 Tax=Bacillus salipaludis TaxID=2547811 RepID=A0A4R5VTF8_9BACI|nr:teichoic acids export ABC transporter ATP-binding subunit TagH [Bacillus salipaludis]TDK62178.1 teichoic acids export ABC transporter ATP-binding subunit TagH [Bacillus salipaludis]
MSASIVFKNVTKNYKMYKKTSDKLLDLVLPKGYGEDFYALQNISFEAEEGDVIGIIGVNGAGKSTISNLISGVVPPSSGSIKINGEAALISIGAGFNNQLTGRENIELKCLMLGFSKKDIQTLIPEIIEFADIGPFIDQPVKKYSSGMKSRLGFAISVNINPDILVIDEALSVGDKTFTQKCLDKMNSFKEMGKTIFFISHSIGQVKEFCQKALWLEAGEIRAYGTIEEIIPQYEKFIKQFNKMSKEEKKQFTQQLLERRSEKRPTAEEHEDHPTMPIRNRTRKNPKRIGMKNLSFILGFVLILASAGIYLKLDKISTFFNNDEKVQAVKAANTKQIKANTKDKPVKKASDKEQKDIRYVQVDDGFVRNKPDLVSSEKISMVYFGESITVEQEQKDPTDNINWLKFKLDDGREAWISDKLVTKVASQINEDSFIPKLSTIAQVDQFTESLGYLGKIEKDLSLSDNNSAVKLTSNQDGRITEVDLAINGMTPDQIHEQFGTPVLSEDGKSYLYHGKEYDFIFYSTNANSFNQLTIKQIQS